MAGPSSPGPRAAAPTTKRGGSGAPSSPLEAAPPPNLFPGAPWPATPPAPCHNGPPPPPPLPPSPGPPGARHLPLKPGLVPGRLASGLRASRAAVSAATQRRLAASALAAKFGPPAWKTIPSWAVIGTADHVIPFANQTFMAQRAGAHITVVKSGHLSLISKAQVVTRVILQAAQATA